MERTSAITLLFLFYSTLLWVANGVAPPTPSAPATPTFPTIPTFPRWPIHPPLPPNVQKCWSSFGSLHQCFVEISQSFWSRRPLVSPACCEAIQEITDDCEDTVFGHFNNPFFAPFLRAHCSQ